MDEDEKKKKERREFYMGLGQAYDLSWRIAAVGVIVAGAIYFMATSCVPRSGLEKKVEQHYGTEQTGRPMSYISPAGSDGYLH
ncbi:hypothetical protein HY639_05840 [Candidatus Woesearchaeota archaeon]|nr:hypothetical protein [Candidatus Woesearchaeota archaeon]